MDCFNTIKKKIQRSVERKIIIADVGSGNGVPGLIWAICCKDLNIVLIEKVTKKVAFLNHAIGVLKLNKRVATINKDVNNLNSKQFDIITSRAFSNCENFLKSTKSISKKDTSWMIMTTLSRSSALTENKLRKLRVEITNKILVTTDAKLTNKEIIWFENIK